MKKVKISISVNSIYFAFSNKYNEKNINQTSYIETGNLLFEYDYIRKNPEIMSSFIKDITNQTKIEKLKIKNMELVPIVLKIVKNNPEIKKLHILDNKIVDTNSFLTIVDNKNIKYLNCYNMSGVMFNYLNDRKNILIELRKEFSGTSNFIIENKLNKYSNIYYKKNITINNTLNDVEQQDLETFMMINKHLQTINIKEYSLETLESIVNLINTFKKSKIKINIHQTKDNISDIFNDINEIKKLKNKNINIKIVYEKDYIFKNFFKQVNLSLLRFSFLVIFILLIITLGITKYLATKEDNETKKIINNINDIVKLTEDEIIDESLDNNEGNINITDTPNTDNHEPQKPNAYKTKYDKVFTKLKEINKDTIGWLTVNNTDIDYPVVQAEDNDYYLKHSFDNTRNSKGWIFADYRNNFETLDDNTIIYGHNLKSGYMFGTLKKTLNANWYSNQDNLVITFNTIKENYNWQIFSIYTMEKNNDYLVSSFANETNFNNYIKNSKEKSIIDFGIEVQYGDNILTLSTCYIDSNQRLIIQAKLIK